MAEIKQEDIDYWREYMEGMMDDDDILDVLLAIVKESGPDIEV